MIRATLFWLKMLTLALCALLILYLISQLSIPALKAVQEALTP